MTRFKIIRVRPTSGAGEAVVTKYADALPEPVAPAPLTDYDGTNQNSGVTPQPVQPAPLLTRPASFSVRQQGLVPAKTERRGLRPVVDVFTYYFNQQLYKVLRAFLAPTEDSLNGTDYVEGEGIIEVEGNPPPEVLLFEVNERGELLVSGALAPKFSLRDGNLFLNN